MFSYSISFALALASTLVYPVASFVLTPTGQTLVLDGVPYYAPPEAVTTLISSPITISLLEAATEAGGLLPLTVVSTNSTSYSAGDFAATVASFTANDDVFSTGFLAAVWVQYSFPTHINSSSSYSSFPPVNLTSTLNIAGPVISTYPSPETSAAIPNGPYFLSSTGSLHQAWRLYSDTQGAFFETTIAGPNGSHRVLPANVPGQHLAVAVPSRLYFTRSPSLPLSGVRVGVKDIFDLAGLRTSNGNRAWYHFYGPANTTALAVQRLIDAGAVIVGKMATSQFANGETATADWVDYHEPFNPRGDGYQDTSSSSAGPGAGTGAYDWLDLTLGSDTGGSIRGPSAAQGVFGNRASLGLVPLTGVMPMSPESDTAGFLTRDPGLWAQAAEVMYGSNITMSYSYPSLIRTIEFPTTVETDGDAVLVAFLANLTAFLNGTTETWNITSAWSATHPLNVTADYTTLLNLTYPILIGKHEVSNLRDPFYAAYAAVHDGRRPAIDPAVLIRWNFSDAYPISAIDEAKANNSVFADWFSSEVLVADDKTCSNSLMLYVGGDAATQTYRNVYRSAPSAPFGYSTSRISPYWGGPDFVLPVGVASYFSSVTNHTEVLPVTVDIMAARGCDGMLFGLVQDLFEAGIVGMPLTGYSGVTGGEVLFRREVVGS